MPEIEFFRPPGGPRLRLDDTGGAGMPVVFQHGLCGDAGQPAEVFPHVSALRRLTLESRGHGQSEAGDSAAFSIAAFAADIVALIEARKLAPVVVGGISMGAAIALRIAVLRPDLVRGLILARPAWLAEDAPVNMRPNGEVGDLLRKFSREKARAAFEASATATHLAAEAPDNLSSLRGFFGREPQASTAALLCAIAADGPGVTRSQIAAIAVPALIIGHARDFIHPLALARELADLVALSRLETITPKALDRRLYVSDFRRAMLRFLEEIA
jgi:pimeloyl-ACP methyl ester carboxylesterase